MQLGFHENGFETQPAQRLVGVYVRWTLWYLLAVAIVWALGFEGIYYHPTPFYGLLRPEFDLTAVPWHLLAVGVFLAGFALWRHRLRKMDWFEGAWSSKTVRFFVLGLMVFAILFPAALASVREGPSGIVAPYERHRDEYIGDIGKGLSIRGFFRDYIKMHPHLSMHSKVHPPGPAALLWLFSMIVFSQEAFPLAIMTIVFGATALIPLYFWAKDMTGSRVALTACSLYVVVPTIVLFTATSADILFMPFTLTTLFLFWRALHRPSIPYALGAGFTYALMSLLSFSLVGIGAFFAFMGLWRLGQKGNRRAVFQTAALMLATFVLTHLVVWWWSGFDVIACFQICKAQFDTDQANLDLITPRFPWWSWKILNPLCWLYFAGIPVSVLFLRRVLKPEADTRTLFLIFGATLVVLDVLYLARGEGERSAMYIIPFLVIPAAHVLDCIGRRTHSIAPLAATVCFMAAQCWLTEVMLYTYW
jgi:hypothetical protein